MEPTRQKKRSGESPEARRFVQVKSVVMQSGAWRDCDYSFRCAFLELSARLQWAAGQSDPLNNGRLWLSRTEWERAGFAPATVTRATKQLIKVGLLFRIRSGGLGRGCSEYAITCYSLPKDATGMSCSGFRKDAWAKYVSLPAESKKSRGSKMNRDRFKNDSLPLENLEKQIKSEQAPAIIFVHQESKSTNLRSCNPRSRRTPERDHRSISYACSLLIRRQTTADRGLLRARQCH